MNECLISLMKTCKNKTVFSIYYFSFYEQEKKRFLYFILKFSLKIKMQHIYEHTKANRFFFSNYSTQLFTDLSFKKFWRAKID